MFDKLTSRKYLPVSATVIASIILILTLFVFQLGVEDNGTLGVRLSQMGLYDISVASGSGFYSQHLGVANKTMSFIPSQIIYTLCKQFFGIDTVMNTMFPAAVYALIYIIGVFFLFKSIMTDIKWSNILEVIVCLFVFCDSSYTSYFNTPYSYAPMLAFLPLFFASVIMGVKSQKVYWFIISVFSGIFVFGSNCVSGVIGVIFSVYFLLLMFRSKVNITRFICGICACVVLVSSVSALSEISVNSLYDSIFYGVLNKNADDASKLQLDEYKHFAGVPSFDERAQELILSGDINEKLSYNKVIFYYLRNPHILYKNTEIAASNGTSIRTGYLGNLPKTSGKSLDKAAAFSLYSILKLKFIPNKLLVFLFVLVLICYFSVLYRNKYAKTDDGKICSELSLLSSLCSVILIPAVIVLFGVTQITFNMFVFNIWFDISLIWAVSGGTKLLWVKRQLLKEEYGVNQ